MARLGVVVSATALAVVATMTTPALARTDSAPSLHMGTSVAGQASPVTTANTGGWTNEAGIWTATVRSASPEGGRTQIDSTWTSPTFRARPHQVFFDFDIEIGHQGGPSSANSFVQAVRLCTVHTRCSPWEGVAADGLPNQYTDAVPFQVTTGIGQAIGTLDKNFHGYVKFRFRQIQRGLDEQTMTLRVAVGAAAARLQRQQTS